MNYAAFVPFKSSDWHTRLSQVLTPEQRQKLALYELAHVLSVLGNYAELYVGLQKNGLNETALRTLLSQLVTDSITIISVDDVNTGIQEFYRIIGNKYEGVFICGSDLPGLKESDIQFVLGFSENVVFSSAKDGGTPFYRISRNEKGFYVPELYLEDGKTNTQRQIERLSESGLSYRIVTDIPGLVRDLDTPNDIFYFLGLRNNSLPIRYLRELRNQGGFTSQNFF
ncbi:MAG: hypothetical protein QW350_03670 [Candidatus Aenigmatarchaeota archaeon]